MTKTWVKARKKVWKATKGSVFLSGGEQLSLCWFLRTRRDNFCAGF